MRDLPIYEYFLGLNQTKKDWQNGGARFYVNIGEKVNPLHFWKGAGCNGIIKNQSIDGGKYTKKWVLFHPFCDV